MKFSQYKYERSSYENIKEEFTKLVANINNAAGYEEQKNYILKLNKIRNDIQTNSTIASIRYSIDTSDEYYEEEKKYWDEYMPFYEDLNCDFYKAIVNSPFKEEIIKDFSKQFYNICEDSIKSFSKDIIEDLQEENMLCSKYTKLLASAKLDYKGETHNLSSLMKYMMDKDRDTRIESTKLYYSYFEENEAQFDELFDKLVAVRDKMAKKLGYDSFTELGYIRMNRSDYNEDMIKKLRQEVQDYIVPLCNKLYERQANRIKTDDFWFADESIEFETGNATIKGGEEYEKYIIDNGKKMYSELSPETAEFFEYMTSNELMDLVTRKSKAAGGYCTHIPNYNSPFIFSNFNNTSEDIDVLTHEAGHAFQLYMSRDIEMYEINFPTLDSCEIHSMSMEFITYPWMELFFKEDTLKYKFYHMSSAIKFIPYGVIVDEFQHRIYENPKMTADERKRVFRDLEKKYLPHRDYRDIDILEKGCYWFKQGHIFKNPFYYIDYVLAQVCAFQFLNKSNEDFEKAWKDYLSICKVGGTKSFLEIVEIGNLESPFEENTMRNIAENINKLLENIKDSDL
ncbi:M3 family oligoendopeptidase [Intestinibacter bartlettii]|uniref:M3 family oligoendopeptidase n=1 Tax=Intestinibacter bartlettii TaxID=261299 RepID=A0ABS6DY49_9FIRM|nr:M3 family oligoendopeptidase [Intestinibacter bartlettii]MBU5336672.1 M3 family oligoendopeptidase [Intestinibacter bartlettii]MDO5010747.1 M3 family oligoendopeptidase [Intestinibacter bartlettii]